MEKSSDILIVGGGIIGLSCGWQLLKDGHDVTLIDAAHPLPRPGKKDPLAPASLAAAGMLAPSFEDLSSNNPQVSSSTTKFQRFCYKSNALWENFHIEIEAESGIGVDYKKEGTITLPSSSKENNSSEYNELLDFYKNLSALDKSSQWLTRNDLFDLEPNLSFDVIGGIYSPDEKQVDPILVHHALSQLFLKCGGEIVRGWKVKKLLHTNAKITGTLSLPNRDITDGSDFIPASRQTATSSDGLKHSAPIVILASGAALSEIECDFTLPDVFPVKGEAVALNMANIPPSPRHVIRQKSVYICPKSDGRAIIGATSLPHKKSPDIDDNAIQKLRFAATELFPHFRNLKERHRWMGLRPATPDGLPILGTTNTSERNKTPDGLLFAIGHYRNGILLAPATAQIISNMINSSQIKSKDIAF